MRFSCTIESGDAGITKAALAVGTFLLRATPSSQSRTAQSTFKEVSFLSLRSSLPGTQRTARRGMFFRDVPGEWWARKLPCCHAATSSLWAILNTHTRKNKNKKYKNQSTYSFVSCLLDVCYLLLQDTQMKARTDAICVHVLPPDTFNTMTKFVFL